MVSCSNALKKTLKTLRWVIRIRKSQNDRQHNGQKRKDNDLQNTTQKNKSSSNTNPTKTRGELGCSGRVRMQFLLH